MSNIPAHVLLGTPKEATAYIYQIRAMRKASPTLVNTLNTAFAKQAYSWEDFKTGLTTSKPLAYGLAGAGTGGLLAALNEERKKKKNRDYSNVLWGALTGGGLGAGGAYLNDQVGGVSNALSIAGGGQLPHGGTTGEGTAAQVEAANAVAQAEALANAEGADKGLIHNAVNAATNVASGLIYPGGKVLDTLLPASYDENGILRGPAAAGIVTSGLGHGGLSLIEGRGNRVDLKNATKPAIKARTQAVRTALPEAVRHQVAGMDVPMMDAPGTGTAAAAAVPEVHAVPARPPTYKDGTILQPDGTYNQVIDDPGSASRPGRPGVDAVEAVAPGRIPVDATAARTQGVKNWVRDASQGDLQHLINGGTVQIDGTAYRQRDLVELLGDTTVKPVPGGMQFAPNTLANLSSGVPMSGPRWLQNLRRKLPGAQRTPPGVISDVATSIKGRGGAGDIEVPKNSLRGKFGRNPALRRLAHLPLFAGLLAELAESDRTEGKH